MRVRPSTYCVRGGREQPSVEQPDTAELPKSCWRDVRLVRAWSGASSGAGAGANARCCCCCCCRCCCCCCCCCRCYSRERRFSAILKACPFRPLMSRRWSRLLKSFAQYFPVDGSCGTEVIQASKPCHSCLLKLSRIVTCSPSTNWAWAPETEISVGTGAGIGVGVALAPLSRPLCIG